MTTDEAQKINDLYKTIDVLNAENASLKLSATHDHSDLTLKLQSIEAKLDKLLEKGKTK